MQFGIPHDLAQLVALVVGVVAFFGAARIVRPRADEVPTSFGPNAVFLFASALVAAALSTAYVTLYLRGGPRIIDATSYFLEARGFAAGHLAFQLDEPVASTLGRFLLRTDSADGTRAAVIFPPGYPALLALGFVFGHPLAIGPLLAAAITCSTWMLARCVADAPPRPTSIVSVPHLAVVFSVACAALRYHTADTMSHGLSALCFSCALMLALGAMHALRDERIATPHLVGAGFFTGWLVATRPVSALALALVLAVLFAGAIRARPRAALPIVAATLVGTLPGLALLLAHQHAATGEFFASSQTAYYAVSDGPPGCFRYGFGDGVGCVGEHGEFVQRNMAHGYGAFAAAATTLRRLKQHLVDAGNSEPFALVVIAGAVIAFRDARLRILPIGALAQIAAYIPFYFDGNYPGGGARFYADVLPLEHVLAAIAVSRLADRASDPRRGQRLVSALLAFVPIGFAFRAGFDHAALRDRDGGRPMFEPSRLPNVQTKALLFVDTDHGFNLAFDPAEHVLRSKDPTSHPWHVARYRGDALDLMAWQTHGKPATYRYVFPLGVDNPQPRVVPYEIDRAAPLVIEAENLWPPVAQDQGYALTSWPNASCASARRWLVVTPVRFDEPAAVSFALPTPFLAGRRIAPRLGLDGPAAATVSWVVNGNIVHSENVSSAPERERSASARCVTLPAFAVPEAARTLSITVVRAAGFTAETVVAFDRIDIEESKNR